MPFLFEKPGEFERTASLLGSVAEFLDCVRQKWDVWFNSASFDPKEKTPWFRGVKDEEFRLIPGIYRGNGVIGWDYVARDAVDMQAEFAQRAKPFLSSSNSYGVGEYLHLMQHYGMPTRLLDWTEGALVAAVLCDQVPRAAPRSLRMDVESFLVELCERSDKGQSRDRRE